MSKHKNKAKSSAPKGKIVAPKPMPQAVAPAPATVAPAPAPAAAPAPVAPVARAAAPAPAKPVPMMMARGGKVNRHGVEKPAYMPKHADMAEERSEKRGAPDEREPAAMMKKMHATKKPAVMLAKGGLSRSLPRPMRSC